MRVLTLNANGIRAARLKGFFPWMRKQKPQFVCIQEIKARLDQLKSGDFFPPGYHCFYHTADRPGYSGVALYSARQPDHVHYGLGWNRFDAEGRWLQADFGNLSVVSLYVPSGSSGEARQRFKFGVLEWLLPILHQRLASGREYLICGDWNIAHKAIDLRNWRSNQKNSGFLPEERAWMDTLLDSLGWVDAFRVVDPREDQYTWWSNRGQAWKKNVGWRIDYQIATPGLGNRARAASIYTARRFSDHAPLTMDYDWLT